MDSPPPIDCLQPLTLRLNVAFFVIIYRYLYANRSYELVKAPVPQSTVEHDLSRCVPICVRCVLEGTLGPPPSPLTP